MIVEILTFSALAFVLIVCAIMIVMKKNLFHSTLFLMLFLFTMAGMFIHLQAELLASVQVLAYVGGVTTFILFVLMLSNKIMDLSIERFNKQRILGLVVMGFLFVILTTTSVLSFLQPFNYKRVSVNYDLSEIGKLLVSDYLLPFEVISIILTVTMIGAILLVKKEEN